MTDPMQPIAESRVLAGSRVVDADGPPRDDHAVWIGSDGRIAAVGPSDEVLGRARRTEPRVPVTDMDGAVLAPGLINMHVHLSLGLPGPMADRVQRAGPADLVLLMADSARRTLHAGVTTARLVGESGGADFALRRGITAGAVDGPRLYTAGQALCCTGGHGHDADALEADGADGFRRATRAQIRAGADLIKVCVSGGIAGEFEQIDTPQLTDEEMAAVIETAHDWGRQVTAHAGPTHTIARAVGLGLDGVEHGYQMSTELTDEMARRGVRYCPTITVSRCKEFFELNRVPPWMMDRALSAGPDHWASLQRAIGSGVPIVMGSDMPPFAPFDGTSATVREMEFMAEAGLTARQVFAAATTSAADWLGAGDDVGQLTAGRWADLIVLDADPTADVSALRGIRGVLAGGRVHRDDRNQLGVAR